MNKMYFISLLFIFLPFGLSAEEATTDDTSSLPCLKVSSACRKYMKDNKSAYVSTQACIDDLLQGKAVKGLDVTTEFVSDCKKVRSQLKTK